MFDIVWDYLQFYQRYALTSWNHMRPMQYGGVLIAIALVGWLLMKGGKR